MAVFCLIKGKIPILNSHISVNIPDWEFAGKSNNINKTFKSCFSPL